MALTYLVAALIAVILIAVLANRYFTFPRNVTTILNVVLALMVVGMGLWLINTYVPMAGSIRGLLNVVVFLATCVGVLQAFGLWSRVVKLWHDLIGGRFNSGNRISTP